MSIKKRYKKTKKIFYEVQVYVRGVRVAYKCFDNRAAAHSWHDREKENLSGTKKYKQNLLFSEGFHRYLKEAFPLIQIATQQTYEKRFRYLIDSPLFHVKMADLNADCVHTWINWMKEQSTAQNKKRKSFRNELRILSAILNWYRNFVDEDFNIPITKKHRQLCFYKAVAPRRPDYFIKPEDARKWVQWIKENKGINPSYWRLAVFMLLTGARISEACGMCWDAVDLEEGIARVVRRMRWDQKTKKPHLEEAVKTKSSIRLLHLPNELIGILKEMKKESEEEGLLFKNLNGKPLSYTKIPIIFNAGFKALNLPWTSTHICRHTYATMALIATRDISAVQASLGHSSSQMTERYAKVVALLSRDTAEKTAQVFQLFSKAENISITDKSQMKHNLSKD